MVRVSSLTKSHQLLAAVAVHHANHEKYIYSILARKERKERKKERKKLPSTTHRSIHVTKQHAHGRKPCNHVFELTRIIMVSEQAAPGGEGGADQ